MAQGDEISASTGGDVAALFATAFRHHQSGQLDAAQALYSRILDIEPDHVHSLHLMGMIAHEYGRSDLAVVLIGRAIAINEQSPTFHMNIGVAFQALARRGDAIMHYQRALALDPGMVQAHNNLGTLLVEMDNIDEAARCFERVLAYCPDHAEAQANLAALTRPRRANPAERHNTRGNALMEAGRFDDAVATYRKAIAARPDYAEAHYNLAIALQKLGQYDEAVASYRAAIAHKPDLVEAHINLGNVLRSLGRLDEAVASCHAAIAIRPDVAVAHNNLGNTLRDLKRFDEAVAACRQAVLLQPDYAEAYSNLGNMLRDVGRLDEALGAYEQAVAIRPNLAEAHSNQGNVLRELGRLDAAAAACRQALAIHPDYAEAHSNLGSVLRELGQYDAAIASYEQALAIRPDYAEAHSNLGNALRSLGRFDEAIAACRQAIAFKPDYAEAYSNMAIALMDLGQLDDAIAACRDALALKPDYAEAHSNLAIALIDRGQLDDAIAACRQAIAIKPDLAEAHSNLGNALKERGWFEDAAASCRDAIAIKPDFPEAHANLGNALQDLGRFDEARACYLEALRLKPDYADAHTSLIFSLDFDPSKTVEDQQGERTRWYQAHGAHYAAAIAPHANIPDPERPLRIGYVSANLKNHSASFCYAPVMCGHDPQRYQVFAYSDVKVEDALTATLRQCATGWRSTLGKSDEQVAAMVRADEIDVLVDIAGHCAGHRLLVFARKPAPVQVTAWGQAAGTGIPQIDAFLGDAVIVPPDERHFYAETVADLPCIVFYGRPDYMPAVGPLPAIANGFVTFGCLNRLSKVMPHCRAAWARLLAKVPGAKLMLKDERLDDPSRRRVIIESFAAHGIGEDRLILHGRSSHALHLAAYNQVDIALDPFPANGGTTSLESVWMGVPVVSLLGRTPGGRAGASINTALGLTEFVGGDLDAYLDIARSTASDLGALAKLRAELRPRIEASAIGDSRIYTKAVETIYRDFWRKWCAAQGSGR